MNNRGSALIESLGTLALTSAVLAGGLTVSYASYARMWLKHAAYETSICLSTSETTYNCEQKLRKAAAIAVPTGQIENFVPTRARTSVTTRFDWRLNKALSLKFVDTRPLPLIGEFDDGGAHEKNLKERFP